MKMNMSRWLKTMWIKAILLLFIVNCSTGFLDPPIDSYPPFQVPYGNIKLTFSVASDAQYFGGDNVNWFRHVCERIGIGGPGRFMISPGDMVPCQEIYYTIQTYIGFDYLWYPVVGNHEIEILGNESESQDMIWLRNFNRSGNTLPGIVHTGPPGCVETTYSFDYGDVHFVVLNEYYNGTSDTGTDGDISDGLYDWMVEDLSANKKPLVLVFGHEPAYPQPDEESGRMRHEFDSLNQYPDHRDRFWQALVHFGVKAYVCGHTHNYSSVNYDGVWQINAGHAKGTGDQGAKSTFIMFYVMEGGVIWYYVYRLNLDENRYELTSAKQII